MFETNTGSKVSLVLGQGALIVVHQAERESLGFEDEFNT